MNGRHLLAILLALLVIGACGPALSGPVASAAIGAEPTGTIPDAPSASTSASAPRQVWRARPRHRTRWVRHRRPAVPRTRAVAPRIAVSPVRSALRPAASRLQHPAVTARPVSLATAVTARPSKPAAHPAPNRAVPASLKVKAGGALAGTRSDPIDRTQDSPAAALGGSFKMMLYLLPVLIIVSLAIRALKGAQNRIGTLPRMKALLAGSGASGGGRRGLNGAIRVLESTRVGASTIHLVDVRGRSLLLCSSGPNVSVLADVTASTNGSAPEFSEVLSEATAGFDDEAEDNSLAAIMGSLDSRLRDARECVTRSSARVRAFGQDGTDHDAR